ncbi:hypothetical protein NHQ30_008660 [Ciborinia camelliae]|nr:hypothetical protein NHQ30_008660 [Ciborinia camelliae]
MRQSETQGEKAYKSSDPRSRASSSASESAPLKLEPTPHGMSMGLGQMSPNESMTTRTSAGAESSAAAATFNTITGNFQPVNFSSGDSHKGSISQAQLTDTEVYIAASPGPVSSRIPSSYGEMTSTFNVRPMPAFSDQDPYRATSSSFQGLFQEEASPFPNYSASHALPLLRIPEEPYMPGLSHTQDNSPWCSSASDSTYSTQSESSRTGRVAHRGRSGSLVTAPEWSIPLPSAQWPNGMTNAAQDLRGPPYETVMESYDAPYTPPRMSPPSRQLLDVPGFGGYYMESVGNPHTSTYNKHLAQTFPASPPRLSNPRLAILNRGSKELLGSQQLESLTNIGTIVSSPSQSATSHLDNYLSLYWNNFDKLFPFIHRGTYIQNQNLLLTFAMAAIGTQYHPNPEARKHGVEFQAYCTTSIPSALDWTLQIMQAILLSEIFTRFRGKKTSVRLSRQFEELYNRQLLNPSHPTSEINTTPINTSTSDDLLNDFNTRTRSQDIQSNWLLWVDAESRQRLSSLCFIFDIHQAMYHQQKRAKPYVDFTILHTPCSEVLWELTNAADWAINETENNAGQSVHVVQRQCTQGHHVELSHFAQSLIICFLTSQFPGRVDPDYHYPKDFQMHNIFPTELVTLFPKSSMVHTFLALYHTPLRDLLAVSGDTWVFSQKITQQNYFREAQSRLKNWSSSLGAATATHHACRILLSELSTSYIPSADHNTTLHHLDLSHYWSLNVAVLICWAFGHRVSGSSGASSRHGLNTLKDLDFDTSSEALENVRLKALTYLNSMLELDIKELLTSKASMRGETSFIIDAVRTRLEIDSVGDHCMTLVDSICVLKRLGESGRGKWF